MNEERCVSCGEIIPEGRQVCPNCERKAKKKQIEEMAEEINMAFETYTPKMKGAE